MWSGLKLLFVRRGPISALGVAVAAALLGVACGRTPAPEPPVVSASNQPAPVEDRSPSLEHCFVAGDKLSYGGYDVLKLRKQVSADEWPEPVDATYIVVKKTDAVVAAFDGVYHGLGNGADFGLYPFLGDGRNQLVVSLDMPRGGVQWVAELGETFRVIFDGRAFSVGRERDDLGIVDLDGDGCYEITAWATHFYMVFPGISMSETPLPLVVFKYDEQARRYLPANHLFRDYVLSEPVVERPPFTFLSYLFAGLEKEGWERFRREYTRPRRREVEHEVRRILDAHPAYRSIRERSR